MKHYIILSFYIFSCTNAKEEQKQITTREPREWDAESYAQGNFVQEEAALHFLKESGINFIGKRVLDVGCGTGNITAKIAETAKSVHGFDASKNMIEYAQATYDHFPNLSFEQCFAEDFITTEKCDIAVSIFCLHWLEDKQKVFENINNSLEIDGEFFGTIFSASDPASVGIIVLQELLQKPECSFLNNVTITQKDSLLRYVISDEECKNILQKAGFELISYEKKSPVHTFKNRDELAAFQRPLKMRLPLFQSLPETEREWLFNKYIDLFLTKLKKDENDHYIYQGTTTTIIHARKVKDI